MSDFTFDEFDGRWICRECNAARKGKQERKPDRCQNCDPMTEPRFAASWRLDGRSVKMADVYHDNGRLSHELYLSVSFETPCNSNGFANDILSLGVVEAKGNSTSGRDIARIDRDQCAELAVLFWKLAEGIPVDNLVNKEVNY